MTRAVLRDGPMPDAVAHLQALVRLGTISRLDPADTDWGPFDALMALLPELFPATHSALRAGRRPLDALSLARAR